MLYILDFAFWQLVEAMMSQRAMVYFKFIQDTAAQLTDRTEKTKQKGMKSQEWRIKKIPKVIVPSGLIISSST